MSRTVIGVIMAVVAIIAVGALVLANNQSDGNPTTQQQTSGDESSKHSNLDTTGDEEKKQSTSEVVETTVVDIKDSAYVPSKIRVKKGSTVTWTNQDSIRHDVMPDSPSEDFKASELLAKGESYSFTFNTVGTYTYFCTPHPFMKGTIEVVE